MASESQEIADLIEQIAAVTRELETVDHVGRHNRLFDREARLFARIDALPSRLDVLKALLDHPDPAVCFATATRCYWRDILEEQALAVVDRLAQRHDKLGDKARSFRDNRVSRAAAMTVPVTRTEIAYPPKPGGCARPTAIDLIEGTFNAKLAKQVSGLLRRAIGLWPCAVDPNPLGSKLGGMPMVPPGWVWPFEEEEPLLFLGQLNCADLQAAVGDNPLPSRGMLVFFGDHDDVTGCFPTGASAVGYFPGTANLRPAAPPLEDFEPLISCGLDFYETVELPDWMSETVAKLDLAEGELALYQDLRDQLSRVGHPKCDGDLHISKLFGWPDLIQRDLGQEFFNDPKAGENLLLQIGWYHDGAEWECWGPGGHIYVTLSPTDLAARRFDRAVLEMQCT